MPGVLNVDVGVLRVARLMRFGSGRACDNLIAFAIRASQKLRVSHRRAGDEIVGDFVIALRELKQPLSHLFAVMPRQSPRPLGLFAIMD